MKQTQFPKWGEGYHLSLVLNKSWLSENGSGKVEYYAQLPMREQDVQKQNGEKLQQIFRKAEGTSQRGVVEKRRGVT